jgi:hypothetical protein
MMITKEKIEGYLVKLSLSFQEAGGSSWVVSDPEKGLENLLVMIVDSHVIMRSNVMGVPADGKALLFEELLRLNATDMVHGAYGIDGTDIVILDTLELDTLDIEEFQASIDAIGLALAEHYKILSKYRSKK